MTAERVTQPAVVRHWLHLELANRADPTEDVDGLTDGQAMDRLLRLKPGAAAFVWRDAPVEWFRLELGRQDFLQLRLIDGPPGLSWRSLAADDTLETVAARLDGATVDEIAGLAGIDAEALEAYGEAMPDVGLDPLVLRTRRGCVPWRIVDGNHRAVAKALYLRDGGRYEPQPVYLGVGATPMLAPLRERLCGRVRQLLGRSTGPSVRP